MRRVLILLRGFVLRKGFAAMVALAGILLQGCGNGTKCKQDGLQSLPSVHVNVQSLDGALAAATTAEAGDRFLADNPAFAKGYLQAGGQGDTLARFFMRRQATDAYLDTMRRDVAKVYTPARLKTLSVDMADMFAHVKGYYPAFAPPPHVYTLSSGFEVDLLYQDSLLLIGPEFFMPDSAHYEPPQIPRYIRRRMRPEAIVPGVARILSNRYAANLPQTEPALVDELIRWGKAYYFVEQTMPCLPDSILIGYPAETLKDVQDNAQRIYNHFVAGNLFFNKDQMLIAKYTGERPATPEIGDKCPGRIGQWLGLQIVRAYAERTKATLPQVMAEADARVVFDKARYRP